MHRTLLRPVARTARFAAPCPRPLATRVQHLPGVDILSPETRSEKTAASSSSSAPRVLVDVQDDGVAVVTLNRAKKMNALDLDMFHAVVSAADDLRPLTKNGPGGAPAAVRACVIRGEGRSFCAGLDMNSMIAKPFKGDFSTPAKLLRNRTYADNDVANLAQALGHVWRDFPVPVVAALHGVCLGGGLQLAMGCDMRFAEPRTRLSVLEAKWGLIPDMGASVTLPECVALDVAKELTLTGRLLEGTEAAALGLVTGVAEDPLAQAMAAAREIANDEFGVPVRDPSQAKGWMADFRKNQYRLGGAKPGVLSKGAGGGAGGGASGGGTWGGKSLNNVQGDSVGGKAGEAGEAGGGEGDGVANGAAVAISVERGMATVSLHASSVTADAVDSLYTELEADQSLRGVVVTLLAGPEGQGGEEGGASQRAVARRLRESWMRLPVPVICVMSGHCDSLSLLASLGADFRFCNSACQLEVASVVEPDILGELSVNPEGHAGGQTAGTDGNDVPRREDLEEDLAFLRTILRTDRVVPFCDAQANGGVISGQDALGLGLVTKVTENPHMDALTLAHMIAAGSPDAVSAAKQLYNSTWYATEAEALLEETRLQEKIMLGWNHLAASSRQFLPTQIPYIARRHSLY